MYSPQQGGHVLKDIFPKARGTDVYLLDQECARSGFFFFFVTILQSVSLRQENSASPGSYPKLQTHVGPTLVNQLQSTSKCNCIARSGDVTRRRVGKPRSRTRPRLPGACGKAARPGSCWFTAGAPAVPPQVVARLCPERLARILISLNLCP